MMRMLPDRSHRRLALARTLIGLGVIVLVWLTHHPGLAGNARSLVLGGAVVWLFSVALHFAVPAGSRLAEDWGTAAFLLLDLVLAALIVHAGGDVRSPYAVIFGLVILASGLAERVMLPIVLSVAASALYLLAVGGISGALEAEEALHALLQVSALLLAGGVMAAIVRRHRELESERKEVVRRHRSLQELFSAIMETMDEGLVLLDAGLTVTDANPAARRLLGFANAPGQPLDAWLSPEHPLARHLRAGDPAPFSGELEAAGPDGGARSLLVRARALEPGSDAAWLITLVDVTERKALERQLVEQERMAALGQMSAMLAHEIRNPVQTIAQGLELMRGGGEVGFDVGRILHEEMYRLNRMVTMMLDYARPLKPRPRKVRLAPLIEAALLKPNIDDASAVRCDIELDEAELDPDHFRLVLDNLVDNALAHARGEQIRVRLEPAGASWQLTVSNAGEIDEEMRRRIFEPYASGRASGIGLGLAIVKQVCDANGWSVEIDSEPGRTHFIVRGPTTIAASGRGRADG